MSRRPPLSEGQWCEVASAAKHEALLYCGLKDKCNQPVEIHRGEYNGPGSYLVLEYTKSFPRGGEDDVRELIPAVDVAAELKDNLRELARLYREALKRSRAGR